MLHNDCLFRAVLHTKTACPEWRLNKVLWITRWPSSSYNGRYQNHLYKVKIQYMLHNNCLFRAVLHTKTACPERRFSLACTMGSSGLPQTIKIQELCNALTQTRVKIQQRCTINLHCARKQHSVGWYDVSWIFTQVSVCAFLSFHQRNLITVVVISLAPCLTDKDKHIAPDKINKKRDSHHTTIHHFSFIRSHIRGVHVCLIIIIIIIDYLWRFIS